MAAPPEPAAHVPPPRARALGATWASLGLRTKVLLGVVGPLVVSLSTFVMVEHGRHRRAAQREMLAIAATAADPLVDVLRHEMAEGDFVSARLTLLAAQTAGRFRAAYLASPSGQVLLSSGGDGVGGTLEKSQAQCRFCHGLKREDRPVSAIVTLGGRERVFRSMRLVHNGPDCVGCHDATKNVLAVLVTDIPAVELEQQLPGESGESLALWASIVLGTGVFVSLLMRFLVTNRLEAVAHALERFGKGQRDLRLPVDATDEIGQLSAAFNAMGQRIQGEEERNAALTAEAQRHTDQQHELLKRLLRAQEDERRRVAHDLHDDLGQDLAALAVGVEGAVRLCAERPDQVRHRLGEMRNLIADMTARAYDLILSLRPSVLDDMGLVPALRAHADRVLGNSGIRFDIDASHLTRRLPPEIETAVFRTLQESLSNVVRHSGAERVQLSLATNAGVFAGDVVDDGRGFDVASIALNGDSPQGLGLLGMRERVALCGGTFDVVSSPGAGTRVHIRIPLAEGIHA